MCTLVTEIAVLRDQVHLRQDIDVREFKVQHYPERSHKYGDVLGGVRDVVCVAEVHGSQLGGPWVRNENHWKHRTDPKAVF